MKKDFPLEALLRPPVELWSSYIAFSVAAMLWIAPNYFMLTPSSALIAMAGFLALAVHRFFQGWVIVSYHRNLRVMPFYGLRATQIPVSQKRMFLGKGFHWGQKHTQRLRDTLRPSARKYVDSTPLYVWARKKEQTWEYRPYLKHLAKLFSNPSRLNPVRPLPPVGGSPQLHAVGIEEDDVWVNLDERVGHALVLGTTRVGKSRLCELLLTQDIRRGDVTIVFDPKGDADLLRRMYAEAKRVGRENDFFLFHLGYPEVSARYNAIGNFSRISEVATRISNQLNAEGDSAVFREFAWRFVNIIAKALVSLGRRPDYLQISQHVTNIEPLLQDYCRSWLPGVDPEWELKVKRIELGLNEKNIPFTMKARSNFSIALVKFLKENKLFDPVADGLRSAFEYDKTYFDKLVATLMPLLEKLSTGKTAELISPDYFNLDDKRPIFDWMQVIRRKGIVYVGLDALSDTAVAAAVGNSMFADLVSVAGQIYKFGTGQGLPDEEDTRSHMPTISLHADEFNELIGNEFIPLLNKAGGAGVQVTAYTQTWSDVEARVGSASKAGQIAGNFNSLIMMRVRELATAEMLTEQLPKVDIATVMQVSAVSDAATTGTGSEFSSRNEDRVSVVEAPMLTPAEVVQLPKGQAFALLEGGKLYKLRLPLPLKSDDDEVPLTVERVAEDMSRQYGSGERWWQHHEQDGTKSSSLRSQKARIRPTRQASKPLRTKKRTEKPSKMSV